MVGALMVLWRRLWIGGVAVLLTLVVGALEGCGASASKTSSTTSTSASPAASPTASAPSAPATTTTTTSTAAGNFDSCSVVTRAEAAGAIGQAVTPAALGNATVEGGLACVFYGPSAPSTRNPNVAQPDSVRVVVVKGPHAFAWYKDYKSKVNASPISGYGDQAYYDGYASLSVLKGDSYLRVAVAPAGAPPSLADEKKLAAAILPKL